MEGWATTGRVRGQVVKGEAGKRGLGGGGGGGIACGTWDLMVEGCGRDQTIQLYNARQGPVFLQCVVAVIVRCWLKSE